MTRGSTAHAEIADPPPRPPPAQKMWMRSPMGKAWRTHSSVMLHLHSHIAFLFPSSEHHRVKKKIASWWSLKKKPQRQPGGGCNGERTPPRQQSSRKRCWYPSHGQQRCEWSEQGVRKEIAQFLFHWNGDSFPSVPAERLFPFLLPPSAPFLSPSLSSLMQVYFQWKSLGH